MGGLFCCLLFGEVCRCGHFRIREWRCCFRIWAGGRFSCMGIVVIQVSRLNQVRWRLAYWQVAK